MKRLSAASSHTSPRIDCTGSVRSFDKSIAHHLRQVGGGHHGGLEIVFEFAQARAQIGVDASLVACKRCRVALQPVSAVAASDPFWPHREVSAGAISFSRPRNWHSSRASRVGRLNHASGAILIGASIAPSVLQRLEFGRLVVGSIGRMVSTSETTGRLRKAAARASPASIEGASETANHDERPDPQAARSRIHRLRSRPAA